MRLFVDIGNTAIKWADELDLCSNVVHRASSHGLPESIEQAWSDMAEPTEVHIASVRHQQILGGLIEWISQHWEAVVRISETKREELGVVNGYDSPTQLGVDRWLALLAARAICKGPVVVVSCGSATTIDGLDGEGRHLGGVIFPGLKLFAQCLGDKTDLSLDGVEPKLNDFATNTASAVYSGAILAHLCMIERMVLALQARDGSGVECILTGGDAHLLNNHLIIKHQLIPALVLQGLALQSAQVN
jgi:type III pantothenate kinase